MNKSENELAKVNASLARDATAGAVSGKAVTYAGWGGYDVISIAERNVRAPNVSEVRIKVLAAAVNPTDILLRDPGLGNLDLPMIPGMDAAGIVDAVGSEVTRLKIGDEVMAAVTPMRREGGAQASYIVVPSASVVHKPKSVTHAEAATVPMNGLTALYALDLAALSTGQTLAVTGGAGWLAYMTITLAKLRGLRVIADAKREEVELVRGYGADVVVDRADAFAEALRREIPEGADALLDTALLSEQAFPALKDGGIYIPVRGWRDGPDDPRIQIKPVLVNEVLDRTDWLESLRDVVAAEKISPRVAGEYVLENVADAQRSLMAGGVRGRPVIMFS
jgi:NADPH2:quinone reductase